MRIAVAASLLFLSTAALGQEQRIPVSAGMRADIARHIRNQGFDCPDVKEVVEAGRDAYGRSMRVTCGATNGRPDAALMFRVSTNATTGRVRPWQP
jgi:hypothetical protein